MGLQNASFFGFNCVKSDKFYLFSSLDFGNRHVYMCSYTRLNVPA